MSKMLNQSSENNCVNRVGPVRERSSFDRCLLVRQRGTGRHPTVVRTKWSNKIGKQDCYGMFL